MCRATEPAMPGGVKKPAVASKAPRTPAQLAAEAQAAVALLKSHATKAALAGMARYGVPSTHALGVPMNKIQLVAKTLGRDHALTDALWATGTYEARLLVAYVGEPERLTAEQMERWCGDFDNWAVVDTLCFVLFDRSPHAWVKVRPWAADEAEFRRRAGYVLIACLAAHNAEATEDGLRAFLPLIERGAADERNFVKKGVSWALRMVGRWNLALNVEAVEVSRRLAASDDPTKRWVGKGALKELTGAVVAKRLAAKAGKATVGKRGQAAKGTTAGKGKKAATAAKAAKRTKRGTA